MINNDTINHVHIKQAISFSLDQPTLFELYLDYHPVLVSRLRACMIRLDKLGAALKPLGKHTLRITALRKQIKSFYSII